MERFQRQLTTAAFKLSGGVDLSSSVSFKPVKQNPIPQVFITRITKGFLDALYAFLDGLVLLASDESPIVTGNILAKIESSGTNHLDLFDLSDGVSPLHFYDDAGMTYSGTTSFYSIRLRPHSESQDIRLLLVISNFEHLADVLIPSMLDQLEAAFGISLVQDRQVSKIGVGD